MKKMLFVLAGLFAGTNLYSQNIDAPVISEWKNPKKLDPEYKYNSASVYLVNGVLLSDLFTGVTLTKEERRKYKLKADDYPKYIYLSLEMMHPKNNQQLLTLPLYLLDATNKGNQLFSAPSVGKVLDEIKDVELDYKPLNATGIIKAIKGNSTNDFVSQTFEISTSLFKTALALKDGPLGANEILTNVQKGGEFFSKIAKDKQVTSDFTIPIIKESDYYKYELNSVSVHQIKWDFKTKAGDALVDIKDKEQKLDEILSKLDNLSPYLIVVRYKSFYSIPVGDINNVEIEQAYLDKRGKNLVEFSGMKKDVEETLLESLKEAISIRKDFAVFARDREVNQFNYEVINRIINSYYEIKQNYSNELLKQISDSPRKLYFESNYQEVYRVLFSKLDEFLKDDLTNAKSIVNKYFELRSQDFSRQSEQDLCGYLQQLDYYRGMIQKQKNDNKSITQILNSNFYPKYGDLVSKIENTLYNKAFAITSSVSNEGKVTFLNKQMSNYSCCEECKVKANLLITQVEKDNDIARRDQLSKLKTEYLISLGCWDNISVAARDSLNHQYPKNEVERLSPIKKKLYEELEKQYQNIISASNEYLQLGDLNVESLSSGDLISKLNTYSLIRKKVHQSVNYLMSSKLIDSKVGDCYKE